MVGWHVSTSPVPHRSVATSSQRPFVFIDILALFREFVGANLVVALGGHQGRPYSLLTLRSTLPRHASEFCS